MSRDRRLRQVQVSRQINDPMIAKGKMSQNRQPGRIPETTKQTRRRRQPSRFIDELSNVIYRFHRHSTMKPPHRLLVFGRRSKDGRVNRQIDNASGKGLLRQSGPY